ncbi:MAG: DUF2703 domain-containing protein [Acidaminococcaceae bacterium]
MSDESAKRCCCGTGCCEPQQKKNEVVIDFLYLDLTVCERCQGAESSLDEGLREVAKVLEITGTEVKVNKININTKELAEKYKFLSSPTIRVNGRDIQMEFKESLCESCGELCGDMVDCRVWLYQGHEYTVPPAAMVIEGILKAVYSTSLNVERSEQEYIMPENLRHFYEVMDKRKSN